jgi:hypothetical protein
MSNEFNPKNELEKSLLAAHNKQMSSEDFMQQLITAEVFLPVATAEEDGNPNKVKPLTFDTGEGFSAYAVFSSPERAKETEMAFPAEFKNGMLVEFTWLTSQLGDSFGVSLNPGIDIGLDLAPDMMASISPTDE